MKSYRCRPQIPDRFVPDSVKDAGTVGVRPSMQAVLELVDTSDPAWPGIVGVLREFKEADVELDAAATATAVKLGRQRWKTATRPAEPFQAGLAVNADEIVYYLRRGEVIKIGTTKDPHKRFTTLMPDEILAFEPGSYELETARHGQFDHLRIRPRSEYFRDEPELREHIKITLAMYGPPDPSWPTAAVAVRCLPGWPTLAARSAEAMTAAEAEDELGIKRGTIYAWHRRNRIDSVGRDHTGQLLFNRDHLAQMKVKPVRRRAETLENFDASLYGCNT